jgi:hypothetical protein
MKKRRTMIAGTALMSEIWCRTHTVASSKFLSRPIPCRAIAFEKYPPHERGHWDQIRKLLNLSSQIIGKSVELSVGKSCELLLSYSCFIQQPSHHYLPSILPCYVTCGKSPQQSIYGITYENDDDINELLGLTRAGEDEEDKQGLRIMRHYHRQQRHYSPPGHQRRYPSYENDISMPLCGAVAEVDAIHIE